MIKRNAAKPVRVAPPMMENQQVLQEFQELHFPESDIQRM